MKKECYQRRSQERHHKQRHDGNRCFGKNSLKRIHWLMLMEMILQKEKDLELAAQIGQSLLEQNHELQTRNEFLEEALNASNDIVVQLRHDLQTRSSLLRFYIDNDIDLDGCTSGCS
ncbi:unnamed protein product [Litomosoides sigmodontis]|uniref:HAP1 N-terminal domain-containing protein n=1 Tax=Litomosoides sigmodontis TaxID=42156 RepID=A0A3P7K1C9_LITSI|nr:unnamed protein product [Litomosoides sigmodontis]